MDTNNESIMLFKLVTGELIIGILDVNLTQKINNDVIYVKHPAVLVQDHSTLYLTKFNPFSKLDFIMITGKNVVYVDIPNDNIVALYLDLLSPRVPKSRLDDEGKEQMVH